MQTIQDKNTDKNLLVETKTQEVNTKTANFGIDVEKIEDIFKGYDNRNFDEDIIKIDDFGGSQVISEKLKSSNENGISFENQTEINNRILEFGDNKKEGHELPHFCEFVWEAMEDIMLRILTLAAIVQIGIGASPLSHDPSADWVDGLGITFAVVVVVLVGSITNYSKEKKFIQLNDKSKEMMKVTVKRNGKIYQIFEEELLVGDLIKFNYGNILPVDGILVEANDVKIDESSMTGESELCKKETFEKCMLLRQEILSKFQHVPKGKDILPSPLVYSGTLVKEGNGWMITLAIGKYSKKGRIESQITLSNESDDNKTPLETKLENIAEEIGKFGLISSLLTLIALSVRLGITESSNSNNSIPSTNINSTLNSTTNITTIPTSNSSSSLGLANKIIHIFILCVAIIVVAIPEGLPLAVTLSLSFSISKMMEDNNLVRKMQACETMGGANFICTDKTGTLTKNQMTINLIFDGNEKIDNSKPDSTKSSSLYRNKEYFEILKQAMSLNINVEFDNKNEMIISSKTDNAFALFLEGMQENVRDIRNKFFPFGMKDVINFPFNSTRKKMSSIIKNEAFPQGYRIYMKGASEIILKSCSHHIIPNTMTKEIITDEINGIFNDLIKHFANLALRTICIAYKDLSKNEYDDSRLKDSEGKNIIEETGFTMISIIGIRDSLREGVDEAISKCHLGGINVIMVTGDNIDTAVAIAKDCRILKSNDDESKASMLGSVFFEAIGGLICDICKLNSEKCKCPKSIQEAKSKNIEIEKICKHKINNIKKFEDIVSNLKVLARSRPEDKYTLVLGLKELGHVVAVTGDGTNDAPALSKSDVGFSMGIQGTDIAKNASDIIILDDNFGSIVKSVLWGRNIFDNIRKFIKFQLTVNLSAVILVFVCSCISNQTPITTIQMLWINMIMDSLGSLALATEAPYEELLNRKPYSRNESIISNQMWKHIIPQAINLFIIIIILFLFSPKFILEENQTLITQSQYILNCFGKIPGRNVNINENYIISGLSYDWNRDIPRLANATYSACPIFYNASTLYDCFEIYNSQNSETVHMTILFNCFVIYTLMNQINARVLSDDFNIFVRIDKFFILIVLIEIIAQVIIVQFGSLAFQCSKYGLTGHQWGICIGFASTTFIISILIKILPIDKCIESFTKWRSRRVQDAMMDETKKLNEEGGVINTLGVNILKSENNEIVPNKIIPVCNNSNNQVNQASSEYLKVKFPKLSADGLNFKNLESLQSKEQNKIFNLRRSSKSIAYQISCNNLREKKK